MKATSAVIGERVKIVAEVLVLGGTCRDVVQFSAGSKEEARPSWNVKERQIRNYIRMAYEWLAEQREADRAKLFDLAVARRTMLYARCCEAGDWRTAHSILKD